jgi:pantothenate kinase
MLLVNISPIYLRCGAVITNSESLEKELDYYKDKFTYIKTDMIINYKTKKLILFQINYFNIEKFKKSPDFEFLEKFKVIENINLEEDEWKKLDKKLSNHKDSLTILSEPRNKSEIPSCYYCGKITGKKENLIYKLFQKKCIRYGNSTDLSISGIDYINTYFENSFFDLPKEKILNLVRVGIAKSKANITKDDINRNTLKSGLYPYLLATGDEGISVYKVDSVDSHKKIGSNTMGPTTIWSLFNLTCNYEDPEFAMNEAFKGNNEYIDLSVGDIYGGDYEGVSLGADLIASSFSKVNISNMDMIEKKDIGKSLAIFYGVTYSQVAAMLSSKEEINNMIISGDTFDSLELMQMIQSCLDSFSQGSKNAVFSDYSKYFEIIGMTVELDKADLL